MADEHTKLMTLLERLRSAGVKSATMANGEVISVEFFASIPALDMDTLVPPVESPVPEAERPESAYARILRKGSVS